MFFPIHTKSLSMVVGIQYILPCDSCGFLILFIDVGNCSMNGLIPNELNAILDNDRMRSGIVLHG